MYNFVIVRQCVTVQTKTGHCANTAHNCRTIANVQLSEGEMADSCSNRNKVTRREESPGRKESSEEGFADYFGRSHTV